MLTIAPAVSAECSPGSLPPMADEKMAIGDAFLATVTEASDVEPTSVGGTSRWHLELAVQATYAGRAPKTLDFGGSDGGGCGDLLGEVLQTGDQIIIAAEDLRPGYQPSDPFQGNMILWHKTSNGWAFFADALVYGADLEAYPALARAADTKAEILNFIAASGLPDTSTAVAEPERTSGAHAIVPGAAFAVGFALALYRFRSRRAKLAE
jgi:hypothetical protein